MLTSDKKITLSGESKIGGKLAVSLSAEISKVSAGNTYVRQTIIDRDLYSANRKECRKDIADFQAQVYDIEDEMAHEETPEDEPENDE